MLEVWLLQVAYGFSLQDGILLSTVEDTFIKDNSSQGMEYQIGWFTLIETINKSIYILFGTIDNS